MNIPFKFDGSYEIVEERRELREKELEEKRSIQAEKAVIKLAEKKLKEKLATENSRKRSMDGRC